MKVHTMFVIGKRDMDADAVSVRVDGKGNLSAKPRTDAIAETYCRSKSDARERSTHEKFRLLAENTFADSAFPFRGSFVLSSRGR